MPHAPLPNEPARVAPQSAVSAYCALTLWQPGVVGIIGEGEKTPPSILHCKVNPVGGVDGTTLGKANAALQVLFGAVKTGAAGNITILTDALGAVQAELAPSENDPLGIILKGADPQFALKTYLALTE